MLAFKLVLAEQPLLAHRAIHRLFHAKLIQSPRQIAMHFTVCKTIRNMQYFHN